MTQSFPQEEEEEKDRETEDKAEEVDEAYN